MCLLTLKYYAFMEINASIFPSAPRRTVFSLTIIPCVAALYVTIIPRTITRVRYSAPFAAFTCADADGIEWCPGASAVGVFGSRSQIDSQKNQDGCAPSKSHGRIFLSGKLFNGLING